MNVVRSKFCSQFCNFRMNCSVADLPASNLIRPVFKSFNRDVGKFFPNFFQSFFRKVFMDVEDPFRELDLN